jgi:vancomycin permeability regulator SanA
MRQIKFPFRRLLIRTFLLLIVALIVKLPVTQSLIKSHSTLRILQKAAKSHPHFSNAIVIDRSTYSRLKQTLHSHVSDGLEAHKAVSKYDWISRLLCFSFISDLIALMVKREYSRATSVVFQCLALKIASILK